MIHRGSPVTLALSAYRSTMTERFSVNVTSFTENENTSSTGDVNCFDRSENTKESSVECDQNGNASSACNVYLCNGEPCALDPFESRPSICREVILQKQEFE